MKDRPLSPPHARLSSGKPWQPWSEFGERRYCDSNRDGGRDARSPAYANGRTEDGASRKLFDLQSLLIRIMEECRDSPIDSDRLRVAAALHPGLAITAGEAVAIVLAVTKIIGNAVEHSHPDGSPVGVAITCMTESSGAIELEIEDDGVGFPRGFEEWRDAGRGIMEIRLALQRIGAHLEITSEDFGVRYQIKLRATP